jgi:hypothetical protein
MIARGLAVWLLLLGLAIANGAVREALLVPRIGAPAAHIVSTLSLCLLILLATWLTAPWVRPPNPAGAWRLGLIWVGLTLSFEFLAGHYLFGASWTTLLTDYDLRRGRVWALVPITTLLAPVLAGRARRLWPVAPGRQEA